MYHVMLVQSNKISCDDFVSKLRSVVGNNVMESAIYNIQSKVLIFYYFFGRSLIWFEALYVLIFSHLYTTHQNHLKLQLLLCLTFTLCNHMIYLLQFNYAS